MSQQRVLLIAAGTMPAEIAAADTFEALSPEVVTMWIAPGAAHEGLVWLSTPVFAGSPSSADGIVGRSWSA
ncbi:MAG TPA: hypothetical protein VM282_10900 [Acidimicrobiales bacterium]|nr:hypothetical protein [Acidimicrobiales bacterium]